MLIGVLVQCRQTPLPIATNPPTSTAATQLTVQPTATNTPTPTIEVVSADPTEPPPTPNPTATPDPFQKRATALPPTPTLPPCSADGTTTSATYPSAIEGPTRTFRIYLPPCYDETLQTYPTIYMLHGNLYGAEEWDSIGIDDEANSLILAGEIAPMIIVMPEGRTLSDFTSGGDFSYEDVLVNELIPFVDATYRTNGLRAIGGLSRGGYWAAEVAFRHPERFTSVGLHAPVFLDTGNDETINPLWTVESAEIESLCIAIDFGSEDVYISTALPIRDTLLARNIPHHWTIYPNGNHAYPYWTDHRAEYIRWYMYQWQQNSCR